MKIYCAGPIKGDTTFQKFYKKIIELVEESGHTAYSELSEKHSEVRELNDKEIFLRDIDWLEKSKMMIAEVSGPSLGVGFEISYSLYHLKIPVLALGNNKAKVSAMISGCNSDLLKYKKYSDEEDLRDLIIKYLSEH